MFRLFFVATALLMGSSSMAQTVSIKSARIHHVSLEKAEISDEGAGNFLIGVAYCTVPDGTPAIFQEKGRLVKADTIYPDEDSVKSVQVQRLDFFYSLKIKDGTIVHGVCSGKTTVLASNCSIPPEHTGAICRYHINDSQVIELELDSDMKSQVKVYDIE